MDEDYVLIQKEFEVMKAEDNDVMITFMGRIKLPEVTFGVIHDNYLSVLENGGAEGIRFVDLSADVVEWLKEAETTYLARVFNKNIYLTVLQIQSA